MNLQTRITSDETTSCPHVIARSAATKQSCNIVKALGDCFAPANAIAALTGCTALAMTTVHRKRLNKSVPVLPAGYANGWMSDSGGGGIAPHSVPFLFNLP